ncbi:hypothetical protein OPV22_028564 [Ensete ventricosum]|uniref:Uncharacterized protein n=1 Tax=Ensete ventricosum TaxID=4639 RepID=A0AAV8PYR0_ENSVE|nr:hypothetical protein OPV22_028564 [Ensete ventricosum]
MEEVVAITYVLQQLMMIVEAARFNTWKATSILVLDTRNDPNEVQGFKPLQIIFLDEVSFKIQSCNMDFFHLLSSLESFVETSCHLIPDSMA